MSHLNPPDKRKRFCHKSGNVMGEKCRKIADKGIR